MTVRKNIMELAVKRVRAWWVPVVFGILQIAAAVLVVLNPWETYTGLSLVFAIFFIVDGFSDMLNAIFTKKFVEGWGWYLISGLFTAILGVVLLMNPDLTQVMLALLVSINIMSGGMIKIGMAISENQDKIRGWGWNLLGGMLQLLVGVFLVLYPGLSALLLLYFTAGAFAIIGLFRIITGLRLRAIKKMVTTDLEVRLLAIEQKIDKVMGDFTNAMEKVTSNVDIIRMATEANVAANMSLDKPDVSEKENVKVDVTDINVPETPVSPLTAVKVESDDKKDEDEKDEGKQTF